ncbi:hypothetical protein Tco_0337202 [Tanacetum coccineum]
MERCLYSIYGRPWKGFMGFPWALPYLWPVTLSDPYSAATLFGGVCYRLVTRAKALIARGVADALAEFEANRTNGNGNDIHNSGTGSRRTERAARECNYSDFLKCQPLNFKGTKRVFSGLTQWFEKMESEKLNVSGTPMYKTVGHVVAYSIDKESIEKDDK